MGYINIVVGSDAKISIKNKQLWLTNIDTNAEMDYPLEDINAIVIESQQSVITTKAIAELAANNIAVYFCDAKHLPSVQMLSYNSFYKNLQVFKIQQSAPKPLQKRLWQTIVQSKITNQAKVLQYNNISNDLAGLVSQVTSGDMSNTESVAALKYFKLLFGNNFGRNNDNFTNFALDYGYSIVRGAIARTIVAHGLVPFLGIHHCNLLNNYNLADDLIEPFRPIVDLYVSGLADDNIDNKRTRDTKQGLVGLLNQNVIMNGQRQPLSYAIEIFVNSFVNSLSLGVNKLILPEIIQLEQHRYE